MGKVWQAANEPENAPQIGNGKRDVFVVVKGVAVIAGCEDQKKGGQASNPSVAKQLSNSKCSDNTKHAHKRVDQMPRVIQVEW
jgi:hypothetical protein